MELRILNQTAVSKARDSLQADLNSDLQAKEIEKSRSDLINLSQNAQRAGRNLLGSLEVPNILQNT